MTSKPVDSAPTNSVLSQTPLIDGHNDLPGKLRMQGYSVEGVDERMPENHTDIVRLREGQVGAQFWSAWVPSNIPEESAVIATLEQVDAIDRLVSRYPKVFGRARTADDVERQFAEGRIASLIGIEGGHSIAESLAVLRMFARLGVRYMTLTHNDDTTWAASATGDRQTTGLNGVGEAIVGEMNRIGMIVDLSHTSESTQLDALRISEAPVIFSHSSVRSVTDNPRNVSDPVLTQLAERGGVIQITFVPDFVSSSCSVWTERMAEKRAELGLGSWSDRPIDGPSLMMAYFGTAPRPGESPEDTVKRNAGTRSEVLGHKADDDALAKFEEWKTTNPQPQATLQDVVEHLEYARELVGIDHLGIGGDYDGVLSLPVGLEDVSTYPALFNELQSRHWSTRDVKKLAGENILRVMRAVEDAAEEKMWIPQ